MSGSQKKLFWQP